jgi:(2Fe-2S) ferredoxin
LEEKLGVKEGHVREDGEFSIEFMECLADCGEGPVVMVGEETFENIEGKNAERFADLLVKKKLNTSKEFVSYENNLVVKSPSSKTTKKK